MGEITEALRRAKHQRKAVAKHAARPAEEAAPAPAVRGEIATPAPPPVRLEPPKDENEPVATFPRDRDPTWPGRAVLLDPRQPHTERFRSFALRVRAALQRLDTRSVLVTSSLRSEGKTFTSCNLALALASMAADERIALVELDARRPAVSRSLGVAPRAGIEEMLAGAATLDDVCVRTELSSLDLYLVGKPPEQAHELLALPSLGEMFRELSRRYDTVIVDSPPVLLVPDVSLILEHVGACISVVRAGRSRVANAREMLDRLPRNKLLGVFVNDISLPRNLDQYVYYKAEKEAK